MSKIRPLSREEEHHLALQAKSGDLRARNRLAEQMLPLVVGMATKMSRGGVRLVDLIQEGNLGLLRAVEKFDPHAGTRFTTYAVWWVRAFLVKYLKQARSVVRPRAIDVAMADVSLDAPVGDDGDATHGDMLACEVEGADSQLSRASADAAVRRAMRAA